MQAVPPPTSEPYVRPVQHPQSSGPPPNFTTADFQVCNFNFIVHAPMERDMQNVMTACI